MKKLLTIAVVLFARRKNTHVFSAEQSPAQSSYVGNTEPSGPFITFKSALQSTTSPPSLSSIPTSFPPSPAQSQSNENLVMDPFTNHCADGFERMTSAECEVYANVTSDLNFRSSGAFKGTPEGCFIWGSSKVYFSTHSPGSLNSQASPVCKRIISPWSASPSHEPSTSSKPSTSPSVSLLPSNLPSSLPTASASPSVPPSISSQPSTSQSPSFMPSLSFSPSSLPSSAPSAMIEYWGTEPVKTLAGHKDKVRALRFSPDGRWVISGGGGEIRVWDVANGYETTTIVDAHGSATISSIDFNLDGTKFVTAAGEPKVKIWHFGSDGTVDLLDTLDQEVDKNNREVYIQATKFSLDGKYIALGGTDKIVKVWDVEESRILHTLTGHVNNIWSLAFTPNGKLLASADFQGEIILWDVEDGTKLQAMSHPGPNDALKSLKFTPDGTQLASGSSNDWIGIWNLKNSTLILDQTIKAHDSHVFSVDFSLDGKYLVSGSDDQTVKLWHRHDNYSYVETFSGHSDLVNSVDFNPDRLTIASASDDKTILIWGTTCAPGYSGTHLNCTLCLPGSYAHVKGLKSCDPCNPGEFQKYAGAVNCESCSAGTYQPLEGMAQCHECRAGGYCSNVADAAACDGGFTACPIGRFNNATGKHNVTSCILCPTGTFSDNKTGLEACFECPKGKYQDNKGKSTCKDCGAGKIQAKTGQSTCVDCLPGTIPDTSRSSCLDCPKGTYSNGGEKECIECNPGSVQNQTGQSKCEICPSGTYSDQSKVTCLECPYPLGSEDNSDKCAFCADGYYLKVTHHVKPETLIANPTKFCLPCPINAHCEKNTTITTMKGLPGFWRDSLQTETFYECNDIAGACLGGTSCARGHSGVQCEVCVDKNEYFDSLKGECTTCPSFFRLSLGIVIFAGVLAFLLIMRYIVKHYRGIDRLVEKIYFTLTAIGIQAKLKICISFCQVVATFQPIYGVRMHSSFTSWFRVFDIFDFGLAKVFGIPAKCFGSMKARLMIGAGWPFLVVLIVVSGIFVFTIMMNSRRRKRKDALAKFWSRSLYAVILIFYLVLPSVCQSIFKAKTCQSFASNDTENTFQNYLIADWSIKCKEGDAKYDGVQRVFWALFAIWSIAVPLGVLALTLFIRPSVQSNIASPLAEACRFLWFDYSKDMMFWEVIDLVRKIILTGLMLFIDTYEGAEGILRLLVAAVICVLYGTILSYARPYKRRDDFNLAVLSNLLLTCCFLVGIIIHECKEGVEMDEENNICMKLFGFSDSYQATALALIMTAAMLVAFILFTLIQSVNELKAPIVRLVSTSDTPHLIMPKGCKYHLFVSHIWASGQDKVHKIVRMLKLYIQGVNIWLDVDVLKNLSDLEESVKESTHFILFYSEGYFKSFNCRREVLKAMELNKPITVMIEPNDDILVDKRVEMKDEFEKYWPKDTFQEALYYIFERDPILWISKGLQFSLESIKLVAGRLLHSLPYYEDNAFLLDAGLKIDGEIRPVKMLMPLDILYCSTNIGAHEVAQNLAKECKGDVEACEMNILDGQLERKNRAAVMLVYLNKRVFQESECVLCDSIIRSIEENIQVVLVHENDPKKGGCAFWQIMEQTPSELMTDNYSIYSKDIAISLYSIEEYQKASFRQILGKMGAKTIRKELKFLIL